MRFTCVVVVCSALLLSACVRATGGGQLIGTAGVGHFGFNADGCASPSAPKGQFQYVDQSNGVQLHGEVTFAATCFRPEDCPNCFLTGAGLELAGTYRSLDHRNPGTGTLFACGTDNGEGKEKATGPDTALVSIQTGPFAGYTNAGIVQGNIQQHPCKKGSTF